MLLLKKVKENNRKKNSLLISWSLVFITISFILDISIIQAQESRNFTVETRLTYVQSKDFQMEKIIAEKAEGDPFYKEFAGKGYRGI